MGARNRSCAVLVAVIALGALPADRVAEGREGPESAAPGLLGTSATPRLVQYGTTILGEAENFDGSRWVATYLGTDPPPLVLELAQRLLEEGTWVYGVQVARSEAPCAGAENPSPNWGFVSKDADCTLLIEIDNWYWTLDPTRGCLACLSAGNDVRIFVNPHLREYLALFGYYLDPAKHDLRAMARVVMGHEHYHNLQYAVNAWFPRTPYYWFTYGEGQARAVQTLLHPGIEDDPTSLWSWDARAFLLSPENAMCQASYTYALYWNFLAARNGGIPFLKRVLDEIPLGGAGECDLKLAEAIDRALLAFPGADDAHADALVDFAIAAYTRDFAWSAWDGGPVYDWGRHLLPVKEREHPPQVWPYRVGAWGLQYVAIPVTGETTVTFLPEDGAWRARLLWFAEDGSLGIVEAPAGTPVPVPEEAGSRVTLSAVRLAAGWGSYAVDVASPGPGR